MYDQNWTRSVYGQFCKDRTRTINIDLCLIQTALNEFGRQISSEQIKIIAQCALQRREFGDFWRMYKRLVKQTPLSVDLLKKATGRLLEILFFLKDEAAQLHLF